MSKAVQSHGRITSDMAEIQRKIIHVDMDAYFAAVEQRDHPQWRGLPVIVGGPPESRGVVCTCSYEARAFGVKSAMPCSRAYRLCPQGIFAPPRFEVYSAVSKQIMEIFHEVSDLVEPLSLDEAYIDVTENKLGEASATVIARFLKNRIKEVTGLTASAGVSSTKFTAKCASDMHKPDGLTVVPPHRVLEFVSALPIGKFFGVGKVTEKKMLELGIRTGADLRRLSLAEIVKTFGKSGRFWHQLAQGIDNRQVDSSWERKSLGSEETFASDLSDPLEMLSFLKILSADVFASMSRKNYQARTVVLKVKYADFKQVTRSRTLPEAPESSEEIYSVIESLFQKTQASNKAVRLLGISMQGLDEEIKPQQQLTLPME